MCKVIWLTKFRSDLPRDEVLAAHTSTSAAPEAARSTA